MEKEVLFGGGGGGGRGLNNWVFNVGQTIFNAVLPKLVGQKYFYYINVLM